jgi:16S rRNA pseudouridine516 synthase
VAVAGQPQTDPSAEFDTEGLRFSVQGVEWLFQARAYLMMHKPAGMECSQRPSAWPSIYTLLPAPLRQRPSRGGTPGVQAIGRLDQDTTGLLLLSDDGVFIHRMSSPQIARLLEGVVLVDDPKPVRAAACEATGARQMRLTLTEGKYHQVKRMVAAVGNRVEALHRSQIGQLELPPGLAPGQWCWLGPAELAQLRG